jgi:hypothetical protein
VSSKRNKTKIEKSVQRKKKKKANSVGIFLSIYIEIGHACCRAEELTKCSQKLEIRFEEDSHRATPVEEKQKEKEKNEKEFNTTKRGQKIK